MDKYIIPTLPLTFDVETKVVLKQAAVAHRRLAELKGAIKSMPNASIQNTTFLVEKIKNLMMKYKHRIREELPKIYSQDLINNLFRHPYTKIEFVKKELNISKPTAISYLNMLCECQNPFLQKIRIGRDNYYINTELFELLQNPFSTQKE